MQEWSQFKGFGNKFSDLSQRSKSLVLLQILVSQDFSMTAKTKKNK